ncbi:hypothetical protein AB1E19_016414 [Capra hircus]
MEELGEMYQRGTELFSVCTDEDPKGRPAAAHTVEASELDVLWSPHTHDYWSLRCPGSQSARSDRGPSQHLQPWVRRAWDSGDSYAPVYLKFQVVPQKLA